MQYFLIFEFSERSAIFNPKCMQKLLLLLLIFFSACDNFETKKLNSEEILTAEARELDWNEVDQYPAFKECRDITETKAAKTCFENKVAGYIYSRMEQKRPVVSQNLHDTIFIHLIVSDQGMPRIDSLEIDSAVVNQLPKIKSWLYQSIDSLPKIYPAIKRGIPVATKFKLPVIIKAE